jgi:hypothetical protein
MISALICLFGAGLVWFAGLTGAAPGDRRVWQATGAFAVGVLALLAWSAAGDLGAVEARAMMRGAAVDATVVLEPAGATRQALRVPLRAPVPLGAPALGLMLVLSILGAAMIGGRWGGPASRTLGALLPLVGAGVAAAVLATSSSTAGGEADVRALLAGVPLSEAGAPVGFTVPPGRWQLAVEGIGYVFGGLGLAVVVAIGQRIPTRLPRARLVGAVGGAIAALSPVVLVVLVGGLPWRPLEGAVWGAALLASAAALERTTRGRKAGLAAGAVTLALAALVLA